LADEAWASALRSPKAGLTVEAARTFEAGLRRFPQDATHRQAYGICRQARRTGAGRCGRRRRAAPMLLSALALNDQLAESDDQLGMLALRRRRFPRGDRTLRAAAPERLGLHA
jgi:hypothetical protein